MVESMVANPGAVSVESQTDEMGVLLTLHVEQADMGKIIGKAGETAKAIRTILRVVGMKENARINLKIAEPEGSTFQRKPRPTNDFAQDNLVTDKEYSF